MKKIYIFSPSLRVWHWVNALAITLLFLTGLYIGNPFFVGSQGLEATYAYGQRLTMDLLRMVHFAAGYVLLVGLLFRFFIAFFRKGDRLFLPKLRGDFWKGIWDMLLYYLFIKPQHPLYVRNPLARVVYLLVYLLLIFMVLTGFAMYGMSNPGGFWSKITGWVIPMLGGEFMTHMWHHWFAWIVIFFVILHVYMVIREDALKKSGEISSMFSGVKFLKKDPVDVEDVS
ncbi:Ni/Fe-hydrogenase, b-type cytochrome subunit [Thermocrinis albus DSM 14484]|uniref:Ni/Fe-hydrogenase, b-type cytochrome subunit n=1 Tax=Thermocrinis albus (strain DSM 14484 / JCM 11386 / HI 11/12) TaxID=638303 RepID=D3SLV9_THEAH|nr:Ni/Fe-hydrogenase, b-type cytochrome subunit [Thermocrinis albus]ADC89739.1 Ni/Fe-hydrogenase, b-type cytochrome subunit [Thermocrinis albus DSM 14484]